MSDKVIPLEELGKRGTLTLYNQAYVEELKAQIADFEKENAELKRDKEDLIFIRNQKAKCMCEDKETISKAKDIIRNLLRVTYGEGWNYSLDVKVQAEDFLKECE